MSTGQTPEILRSPLALTTLKLKLRGVDVTQFDWMDRPSDENLASAARELRFVGAIDENDEVTKIGELAVKLGIVFVFDNFAYLGT
jgi:HrpA-like RNA helicase